MKQLVGERCACCSEPIYTIVASAFCGDCGQPVHNRCKKPDPTHDAAEWCGECGARRSAPRPIKAEAVEPTSVLRAPADDAEPAPLNKKAQLAKSLREFQGTLVALTPHVFVTPILIGINVLVYVLMCANGVSPFEPTVGDLVAWGANSTPTVTQHEWWRLLTSAFVHIGLIHIAFNMAVLAAVGPLVERLVGNIGFLILYLVSALSGSFARLLWDPTLVSAGASGAIFGLYGALLGLLIRQRGSIPKPIVVHHRNLGLAFIGLNLALGFGQATIDNAAHIGGLIGGFVGGLLLTQPITPASVVRRPFRNILAIGFGVLLVIGGMIVVSHRVVAVAHIAHDGPVEVEFSDGATQAEAERLARYFSLERGPAGGRMSLSVWKLASGYQMAMVVRKEFQRDKNMLTQMQIETARVSREVFDGAPVDLHACNERFELIRLLPMRADLRHSVRHGEMEVFFAVEGDRADADRLAAHLSQAIPSSTPLSFKLARRGQIVEVHLVIAPGARENPSIMAGFHRLRGQLSAEVFSGANVELMLCDDIFNVVDVIRQ